MSKYLLAGLGNIGIEYAHTRHNIGFDILDAFVAKHEGRFSSGRLASVAHIKWRGKQVTCIKPTTYMNLSGKAVKYWVGKEKINLDRLLVVVDDKALPLNRVRLRPGGSDGGHNGLKSIQEALQTTQYPRFRFGIGENFPKGMQVDYVLSQWTGEEWPLVKKKMGQSVEILESFLAIGLERTMNQANKMEFGV